MRLAIRVSIAHPHTKVEWQLTVQALPSDGPHVRREQHRDNPTVPEHTDELERLAPTTETPLRGRESLGSAEQPAQTDQTVGSSAGNTGRRDERGERDAGGENGAGDDGSDNPHDDDGVARLAVVHLGYPAGEREHTISGNGEDQTGGSDDGDSGVLNNQHKSQRPFRKGTHHPQC